MVGKVYLVGAGPGDAELLTARGRELLRQAEVVLYDRLAAPSLLLETGEDCERLPVGKREGHHSFRQEEINALLIQKAKEGKTVVRLKGGDPFVFGRGGEEILALEAEGIPYEVVPGVTSAIGALAAAGIPVTNRGEARSFHVITGHTRDDGTAFDRSSGRFAQYAALEGTLIFLMGVSHLEQIAQELLTAGKAEDTPAAIVEQGTTIRQRRIDATLGTIVEAAEREAARPPAILVVGAVAACHMCSADLPLGGLRIGVTGTRQMTDKLEEKLRGLGASVYKAPYVRIREREDIAKHSLDWENYAWLVFTSSNGVHCFFDRYYENGGDIRRLAKLKFAVVGSGTEKTLGGYGIRADYMPREYTVEALAKGLSPLVKHNERVCVLRAAQGSAVLREVFEQNGTAYDEFPLYDTVIDYEILAQLGEQLPFLDYLTFASASGARAFLGHEGETETQAQCSTGSGAEKQAQCSTGSGAETQAQCSAGSWAETQAQCSAGSWAETQAQCSAGSWEEKRAQCSAGSETGNGTEPTAKAQDEHQEKPQAGAFHGTVVCIGDQTREAFADTGYAAVAAQCHTADGVAETIAHLLPPTL